MSLINDMLQDLEKRRAPLPERAAVPRHVRVLPAGRSRRGLPLFAVLAVGGVSIAAAAWYLSERAPVPVSRVPAVASATSVAHPLPEPLVDRAPNDGTAQPVTTDAQPNAIPAAAVLAAPASATASPALAGLSVELLSEARVAFVERDRTESALPKQAAVPMAESSKASRVSASQRPVAPEVNISLRLDGLAGAKASDERPAPPHPQIERKVRELSSSQIAENEYRAGANLLNQGRATEAQERFSQALRQSPTHVGARQALFGLLVQANRTAEAEHLLIDALHLDPAQPGFAMAAARLQVDRGDVAAALTTLQTSVHAARAMPDYLAFHAALLQRQGRHAQSAEMYEAAVALAPRSGLWLMGLGISLQALNRNSDAQDAFRRAKASDSLSGDLQAFVEQRLRQLQ